MTTYVIAGAGGFIGGHVTAALAADERRVGDQTIGIDKKPAGEWWQRPEFDGAVLLDGVDLSIAEESRRLLEIDSDLVVLNFAADMGGMGFIQTEQVLCGRNALINLHLLDVLSEHKEVFGREITYVFASSACVYPEGKQSSEVAPDLHELDAWPAQPQDLYGLEKLFAEEVVRHYALEHGIEARIPRFHAIYGPYGSWTGGREKVPAATCRKVAEAVIDGRHEIEIWGDGRQTRSFCYIDDAVDVIIRLIDIDYPHPVNVGSSEAVTINQLVDFAEIAAVGEVGSLERRYDTSQPQGVRGRGSDNTTMREITGGWEPSTSLSDGMTATYQWVASQVAADRAHRSPPGV